MPITFTCRCGNVLRTADSNAGKPGKCPACSTPFIVPPGDGNALARPKSDLSDYPLQRATRQPVREKSRFDGLTADDVQLRPKLDVEDEEQKAERRRHRVPHSKQLAIEEEDDQPRPSLRRAYLFMVIGVLMMFGGGVWFRTQIEYGIIVVQAPLLFAAGMFLALVGGLRYLRLTSKRRK
jgi:hypothetical protein